MSRKKQLPVLEIVEITAVAAEGKSIARVDNKVLFVTNTVPGDIVDVQLTRKRTSFMEGFPVKFHKKSELRVEPFCSHFGTCGGCKWQNLPYSMQLKYKQQQVIDSFTRIGKVEIPEILPIISSSDTKYYRNKLEYTFSNKRWLAKEEMDQEQKEMNGLGFHIPGRFDKVLNIDECFLQKEPSDAIRRFVREYGIRNGLEFFDLRNQQGFLRTLMIRTSETGEVMVTVVFYNENEKKRTTLLDELSREFPQITSLFYVINQKANDSLADQNFILYRGKDHILEKMEGLFFRVGPKSFYQTNSRQAYELYKIARDFAAIEPNHIVYDLYTGTGTIANFVAGNAMKVTGIEYIPEAIEDARKNSELNGIENTGFFAGDIKDILSEQFVKEQGQPDVMIIDPPRNGMHKDVVEKICSILPGKIVYVSCNPATQARDIQMMSDYYSVAKVQPVDMFPHTHHVENVALLIKK